MSRTLPRLFLFVVGIASLPAAGVAQNRYSIRRIAPLALQTSGEAVAIDITGRVVGTSGGTTGYSFLNGATQALPDFVGGTNSLVHGMDPFDSGFVAGEARTTSGVNFGALWSPSSTGFTLSALVPASGHMFSFANDVNRNGIAVGVSSDPFFNAFPVRWELVGGVFSPTLLPLLPADTGGFAVGINTSSTMVGSSFGLGSSAVRWKLVGGGSSDDHQTWGVTALPSLGSSSQAADVNELQQICGSAFQAGSGEHMVAWNASGALVDLGQFAALSTFGNAIDLNGTVVGFAQGTTGRIAVAAFGAFNVPPTPVQDLNTMIPPQGIWTHIDVANGINLQGQIVGTGAIIGSTQQQSFVLTPVALHLTVTPGTAGSINTWTATGAHPGNLVTFLFASTGGEFLLPGCTASIDLASPVALATVVADPAGTATFSMSVPSAWTGLHLLFQAFELAACANSDVRAVTF